MKSEGRNGRKREHDVDVSRGGKKGGREEEGKVGGGGERLVEGRW
jgi:hypothetical protein